MVLSVVTIEKITQVFSDLTCYSELTLFRHPRKGHELYDKYANTVHL